MKNATKIIKYPKLGKKTKRKVKSSFQGW